MSGIVAVTPRTAADGWAGESFPPGSPGALASGFTGDAFRPAWFGGSNPLAAFGPTFPGGTPNLTSAAGIMGVLSQMMAQVQQQITKLGGALFGARAFAATPQTGSGTAAFQSVSLASSGDPHLSVSGSERNADGTTTAVNSHFDSMTGHDDLFSTRDFGDGFRVSTSVTAPAANGITQNASATATMEGGRETVTLSNSGDVSIGDRGASVALTAGQTVTLSGGQRVSEAANGAISVSESRFGQSLTTTFTPNGGGGVDVTAQGRNVTLAGDLIAGR